MRSRVGVDGVEEQDSVKEEEAEYGGEFEGF